MRTLPRTILALAGLSLLFAASSCSDDDTTTGPDGPFDLTLQGDATFHAPHADQTLNVALVGSDGTVLETMSGTVSATADPAFSITFTDALDSGASYHVDYWIDSNFGGGTEGACDPPPTDHQWRLEVGPVSGDVVLDEDHDASTITDVCSSFTG